MTSKLPTGRFRRAFDLAKVGARAGASWAASRGAEAAAERSAEVLGNLRGLAAKIGQTASYVDGIIPPEQREIYEKALVQLQRATPASSPEAIARVIEQELGKSPDRLFLAFDHEPVASASIGQVHRAELHDGTQVAVKVQHEGIEAAVESDLRNISMLEGVINFAGPRGMKAGPILDEVSRRFREELDYRSEAAAQMAFRRLHEDVEAIRIPRVFANFSTRRVLCSEWVSGVSLEEASAAPDDIRRKYAETLWRFVFRGNLVGGGFNADPHPGNYLFHADGSITFLDFGCVQPIAEETRRAAVRAHRYAVLGEMEKFDQAIAEMLQTHGGEFGEATRVYTRRCFEPMLSSEYRLTSQYAADLVGEIRTMKRAMKAKDGSFVQPPPHLALMNRLQFGFFSVLAQLDVTVNYRAVEAAFLDEAEQVESGLLKLS